MYLHHNQYWRKMKRVLYIYIYISRTVEERSFNYENERNYKERTPETMEK